MLLRFRCLFSLGLKIFKCRDRDFKAWNLFGFAKNCDIELNCVNNQIIHGSQDLIHVLGWERVKGSSSLTFYPLCRVLWTMWSINKPVKSFYDIRLDRFSTFWHMWWEFSLTLREFSKWSPYGAAHPHVLCVIRRLLFSAFHRFLTPDSCLPPFLSSPIYSLWFLWFP